MISKELDADPSTGLVSVHLPRHEKARLRRRCAGEFVYDTDLEVLGEFVGQRTGKLGRIGRGRPVGSDACEVLLCMDSPCRMEARAPSVEALRRPLTPEVIGAAESMLTDLYGARVNAMVRNSLGAGSGSDPSTQEED